MNKAKKLTGLFVIANLVACTSSPLRRGPSSEIDQHFKIDESRHQIIANFYSANYNSALVVIADSQDKTNFVALCNVTGASKKSDIKIANLLDCREQARTRIFSTENNVEMVNSRIPYELQLNFSKHFGDEDSTFLKTTWAQFGPRLIFAGLIGGMGGAINAFADGSANLRRIYGPPGPRMPRFVNGGLLFGAMAFVMSYIAITIDDAKIEKWRNQESLEAGTRAAIMDIKNLDDAQKLKLSKKVESSVFEVFRESIIKSFASVNEA